MCRKLIYVVCFVLVLAASTKVQAQQEVPFFSDDFNTLHDYHDPPNNVAGTGWDDYTGHRTGETVDALNANKTRTGQLYMSSTNGNWNDTPVGPFLYKVVEGDFIATVKVTDYAYTPDDQVGEYAHNTCGVMARAARDPCDLAGPGMDWVAIDYFPIWTCGNFVRDMNDGPMEFSPDVFPHNGKYRRPLDTLWQDIELCDPYLRLERSGNTFHFYTSPDDVNWVEMAGASPRTRDDFDGLPLQVGLRQCTYSENDGYAAFDNFSIVLVIRYKAYNPVPADEAVNVASDANLSWIPGAEAEFHDVYLGTDFDDVNEATDPNVLPGRGRQSETTYDPGPMEFGRTYYWRIDEVNDPNIWRGDVWSFTVITLEASEPSPPDGVECVPVDIEYLKWTAGGMAKATFGHWVYFGTSSPLSTGVGTNDFQGIRSDPCYPVAELKVDKVPHELQYDTLYYWRVDEKNTDGSTTTGYEWSFRTVHYIAPAEPNLVGWWKLDSSCGNIALDSSGYDQHGTLVGTEWVEGYDNGALGFNGLGDYVELPIGPLISSLTNSTFMIWMDSKIGGSNVRTYDFSRADDPNFWMCLAPREWVMDEMYFAITTTDNPAQYRVITTAFDLPPEWHHVAVTVNADANEAILYYDAAPIVTNTNFPICPNDLGVTTNNWLGRSHDDADSYYKGSMYDFRIYNRVLTEAEIKDIVHPKKASDPNPADGATDVPKTATLSWRPGKYVADVNGHDVYFGTDEDAVTDANRVSHPNLMYYDPNYDPNTYDPGTLEFGETYYWRIDEVNNAHSDQLWRGNVWSFTVADYLVVEDFDLYANEDALWVVWKDYWTNGTSAQVYFETGVPDANLVRDGNSMRYWYENSQSPYYSEAYANTTGPNSLPTTEIGSDWSVEGVKALRLYFYGQPDNDINEAMYVALSDGSKEGVVTYGTYADEDIKNLAYPFWHQWDIDLGDFNSAGVDLTNVTRITIGFGDGSKGGDGMVYFDDIQLRPPRCAPSRLKPEADLTDNCVVNYADIEILTERWLESGLIVTPVEPVDGLVGHWKLDGDANDSIGNNDGNLVGYGTGDPQWITIGYDGGALRFDGIDDYVELPIGPLMSSLTNSTFAAWANWTGEGGAWQRIFDFGIDPNEDDPNVYMFLTPDPLRFAITTDGATAEDQADAAATLPGGWHHMAVTIDADSNTVTLYRDGLMVAENTDANLSPSDLVGDPNINWLGRSQYDVDPYYMGLIDDFRIYSRALSAAEVAWLAGRTAPFSILLADLDSDGVVCLKDYAILAKAWLDEQWWPPEP